MGLKYFASRALLKCRDNTKHQHFWAQVGLALNGGPPSLLFNFANNLYLFRASIKENQYSVDSYNVGLV